MNMHYAVDWCRPLSVNHGAVYYLHIQPHLTPSLPTPQKVHCVLIKNNPFDLWP